METINFGSVKDNHFNVDCDNAYFYIELDEETMLDIAKLRFKKNIEDWVAEPEYFPAPQTMLLNQEDVCEILESIGAKKVNDVNVYEFDCGNIWSYKEKDYRVFYDLKDNKIKVDLLDERKI